MGNFFTELGIIIIVATILVLIARFLRQPSILAYVATGVILGPVVFNFIDNPELLGSLSSFGIAFLLFLVGLELNLTKLKAVGKPSLILGIGQVVFTALFGFLILKVFGYSAITAIYIAIALTFSSTIIIVKLLTEKKALDSLHGRLAIGMLLVQDFLAIVALIFISGIGNPKFTIGQELFITSIKTLVLLLTVFIFHRFILPAVFNRLARSDEVLLLASISWCFFLAIFSLSIGFSLEIGAFLAGLSLASLPYNLEIASKIRHLRDFFVVIFFIVLGSGLIFDTVTLNIPLLIILSLFVLIGNPLIVMVLMKLMGYRKRTGFMVGLTVAQISEFSFILVALGWRMGHLSVADVSLVTIIGITTITISTYFITYGEKLYRFFSPYLNMFQNEMAVEEKEADKLSGHTILFGYHRLGEHILPVLQKLKKPVLVIDFNPVAIEYLKKQSIPCFYGDMTDLELIEKSQMAKADLIISTNSNIFDNLTLLQNLRLRDIKVPFYGTADTWHDARDLYAAGATYVIFPHYLAGIQFGNDLQKLLMNKNRLLVDKTKHLAELEHRYAK